ncbi:MAG: hypothetical protein D6795_09735 [Deltaproteobacteria bacterium]|nr:MAG: hypothetical protein D6795_09735 [Deltaproteobacteria bacterium]
MSWVRIIVISSVICVLLFGGYIFAGYHPNRKQIQALQAQLEEKKRQKREQQEIVNNLPKFREEMARVERRFREARAQLPDSSQIPNLLRDIAKKAQDSGLEIKSFKLKPEKVEGFFASVPVDMVIRGRYHDIAVFFDEISRLSRIVNISNLKLSSPTMQGGVLKLTAKCVATTFKFVEGEPASKRKKKKKR